MKTSNKLLIGAFIVIVVTMIIANFSVTKEMRKFKSNPNIELNKNTDSISSDTISTHFNIHVN